MRFAGPEAASPGRILGQLGSPERTFREECCDALLHLVGHDSDRRVLIVTVFALGHLGNRRCEPDLIALRDHADDDVRHGVAFALCGTDRPASVQALLRRASDSDAIIRAEALHGLARRRDERVVPYLVAELAALGEKAHLG